MKHCFQNGILYSASAMVEKAKNSANAVDMSHDEALRFYQTEMKTMQNATDENKWQCLDLCCTAPLVIKAVESNQQITHFAHAPNTGGQCALSDQNNWIFGNLNASKNHQLKAHQKAAFYGEGFEKSYRFLCRMGSEIVDGKSSFSELRFKAILGAAETCDLFSLVGMSPVVATMIMATFFDLRNIKNGKPVVDRWRLEKTTKDGFHVEQCRLRKWSKRSPNQAFSPVFDLHSENGYALDDLNFFTFKSRDDLQTNEKLRQMLDDCREWAGQPRWYEQSQLWDAAPSVGSVPTTPGVR